MPSFPVFDSPRWHRRWYVFAQGQHDWAIVEARMHPAFAGQGGPRRGTVAWRRQQRAR